MSVTETLSKFAAQIKFDDLPLDVVEHTRLYIADYAASTFAGYKTNKEMNEAAYDLINDVGGSEQASVFLSNKKYPIANAAFLNALYAHGADYDDGNKKAAGHIASHVMSSVFALSETLSVTWEDVFVAINVGYEIFNRLGGAAQPSLYSKGFHSTGIAGSVASSAACAKILNLDQERIYDAISLGALQASGLIIIDESGQSCKPINPANAARTGVISAQLAAKGLSCPRNPLESKKGWFNAYSDGINETVLLNGLGHRFTILESYLKLFPSCRHTHCVIEAAIEINKWMKEARYIFEDVKSIYVEIYPNAIKSAGTIKYPKSSEEAKFSLHYCLANSLYYGKFNLSSLNCANINIDVLNLIEKINLISNEAMENRLLGTRGAILSVQLRDGTEKSVSVVIPAGEANRPLTWSDIDCKMKDCAQGTNLEASKIVDRFKNINLRDPFSTWISWIK